MKLSILMDNNTLIDRYFTGEPAFSAYLETDSLKILFDTGYSGAFLDNAGKMGISMAKTDMVIISHGHLDHTWGLDPLIRYYSALAFEGRFPGKPELIAHPSAFKGINLDGYYDIGSLISSEKLGKFFNLNLSSKPLWIDENLVFLGEIPRNNDFEGNMTIGFKEGEIPGDGIRDDSALVWKGENGLVIVTGCSHSGICNIVEYAKEVCGEERILDIIGGFHLLDPPVEQMEKTRAYLASQDIAVMHPCHCTDLMSKIELSKAVRIEETGVGLKLEYL